MKITDAKQGFGNSVARAPTIDRNAHRGGGGVAAALAGGIGNVAESFIALEHAEEEAKADELRTQYEIEYNDKVSGLESDHRENNFSASEYGKRHQTILEDLYGKYTTEHEFNTDYGNQFKGFLDTDVQVKRQRYAPVVQDIALQNQATSWVKGEQNRMNAAVGGDYQTLQDMIAEQRKVYNTPQYQVAYGEKAAINQQSFIDNANARWVKKQLAEGSDPQQLLTSMHQETMFVGVSADARTNVVLSLQQEVKRRDAAAKKAAKDSAKQNEAALLASTITLIGGLNPKDKGHRKAFDHMLVQEVQDSRSPQEAMNKARELRIEYGFIDQREVSQITAAFNSGNPDNMQLALQSVDHYLDSKPSLSQFFNKEIIEVRNLVNTGYDVSTAVDMHKQMQNLSDSRKTALNLQLDETEMVTESVGNVADGFEQMWDVDSTMGFGGWDRPEELNRVAEKVFKDQYVFYNGNNEAAQKGTLQFMAKNYGVTNIGGENRLMFQSPGTYLRMRTGTEFEPNQVKEIFVGEMSAIGIPEEKAERAEIYRIPTNDAKGNPQYQVLIDGQPLLNKSNRVQNWTFDVDTALAEIGKRQQEAIMQERQETINTLNRPTRRDARMGANERSRATASTYQPVNRSRN